MDDDEIEAELMMTEDAPQVVGVIDDRPPELQALDYKNVKWRGLEDASQKQADKQISVSRDKGRRSNRSSEDLSPQRLRKGKGSPEKRQRKYLDDDISPLRRNNRSKGSDSPPRRNKKRSSDDDLSPKRSQKPYDSSRVRPSQRSRWKSRSRSPDFSPKRKGRQSSNDMSPTRIRRDLDLSPPRRQSSSSNRDSYRNSSRPDRYIPRSSKKSESPPPTHSKRGTDQQKQGLTLDGKKAGLQGADDLKTENEKQKRREAEMYGKMSAEMSGRDQEARVRTTGAVDRRKLKEKLAKEKIREEKHAERKEVYDKWGKGVKQVEEYRSNLENAAHEMSKPLARYAGDQDLESHLKEQERLGDPMLNYIRSKKTDKKIKDRVPEKPIYKGLFPDNRFNLRPGYRWDGVDRSNGYEKKYFETINIKKAGAEEAYLYSTEDM